MLVPAAGQIYFARLGQKVWPMDFDIYFIWRPKTHFLQNSGVRSCLQEAVSCRQLRTPEFCKKWFFFTFIWPKYQNPYVKPFGHDRRNKSAPRLGLTWGSWWGVPNPSSQLIFTLNPSSQLLKFLQSQTNIRELWPIPKSQLILGNIEPSTFESIEKNPTSMQEEALFFQTFDLIRDRYPVPGRCPNNLQSEWNRNVESVLPRIYKGQTINAVTCLQ